MVQLWGIYSTGMEVFNHNSKNYDPVEERLNFSLRRARLVISGEPYTRLHYTVAFFYDQIGRDLLSSGIGGTNKADPSAGIWDAFFQWKIIARNDALHLTGGWFRPQMQRESITSGWATTSFEKSMSQNYLRNHLVGTGPGRAAGLNLGGLAGAGKMRLNYNLGIFNPLTGSFSNASAGKKFAPLLAGRLSLSLGDPELTRYGISYETNYLGKRKGVSLDFNFATQGETDLFKSSTAIGPGILLNWGAINLDGEWMWMQRKGERNLADQTLRQFSASTATGHFRAGINVPISKFLLEPTFMLMHFDGTTSAEEQADAEAVNTASGKETTYDAGINWYLDGKNLKLALHYTWRKGDPGDAGAGAEVNQFFYQNGVGAIRRGNWLGLGLGAIF